MHRWHLPLPSLIFYEQLSIPPVQPMGCHCAMILSPVGRYILHHDHMHQLGIPQQVSPPLGGIIRLAPWAKTKAPITPLDPGNTNGNGNHKPSNARHLTSSLISHTHIAAAQPCSFYIPSGDPHEPRCTSQLLACLLSRPWRQIP